MMDAVLARSQIGVEEYLGLVFDDRPEPDYVDGEVVERALPTPIHSQIQGSSWHSAVCTADEAGSDLILMSELRVRIEPGAFVSSISRFTAMRVPRAATRTAPLRCHRNRLARRPPRQS
jgi:hypothetical protein